MEDHSSAVQSFRYHQLRRNFALRMAECTRTPEDTSTMDTTIERKETSTPGPLLTPELRELIMLRLPPSEIIVMALKVSRAWKELIENSPRIQRMLWIRTGGREVAIPNAFSKKCESIPMYEENLKVNPVLEQLSDLFTPPTKTLWGHSSQEAPRWFSETYGNQMVRIRRQEISQSKGLTPKSSCRQMLLTHPPCSMIRVRIEKMTMGRKCLMQLETENEFTIYDLEGIRISLLEDSVQAAIASSRKYGGECKPGCRVEREVYADLFCPL